jgi:WD40 repeat protein
MSRRITRVFATVAAGAALSATGVTGVSVSGAAAMAPQAARTPLAETSTAAIPGAQLWVKRYNGPGSSDDLARSLAVSPSGGRVFVTGESQGAESGIDYATVAYNAATGARLWASRYNDPGNGYDSARSMAVDPNGRMVFVTGLSGGAGPGHSTRSARQQSGQDYATVAYNATTGAQVWVKRYNGPGNSDDGALSVAISPSGEAVFVTGFSPGATLDSDYATVAYNAATGAQEWVKRYNGPGNSDDSASSVAVSPGGGTVFVTGESPGVTSASDYATVAYNAATGGQMWVKRYNGPNDHPDGASSMAVSPSGGTVFVTGSSYGVTSGSDYATVAYNAATGAQVWVKRYNGPGFDIANSVAVSADGRKVFVTGSSTSVGYATVAYNAATGAQLWFGRHSGPHKSIGPATSVTVSPTGGTVFVTGYIFGATSGADYVTIAYRG